MALSVEYENNIGKFFLALGLVSKKALDEIGSTGVTIIENETPVDSGKLKKSTRYQVKRRTVYFLNDAEYAKYVELGTMYTKPNPFMRRGIYKGRGRFSSILINNLGVGK